MFINTRFTRQKMSSFRETFIQIGDPVFVPYIKAAICNDEGNPRQTLIDLNIFYVPVEDELDGSNKDKEKEYDDGATICLSPEDAIKLARLLNMLVSEIFREENYV